MVFVIWTSRNWTYLAKFSLEGKYYLCCLCLQAFLQLNKHLHCKSSKLLNVAKENNALNSPDRAAHQMKIQCYKLYYIFLMSLTGVHSSLCKNEWTSYNLGNLQITGSEWPCSPIQLLIHSAGLEWERNVITVFKEFTITMKSRVCMHNVSHCQSQFVWWRNTHFVVSFFLSQSDL